MSAWRLQFFWPDWGCDRSPAKPQPAYLRRPFNPSSDWQCSIHRGSVFWESPGRHTSGWIKRVQVEDPNCGVVRHESARLTQYALERQPEGQERTSRLQAFAPICNGRMPVTGQVCVQEFQAQLGRNSQFLVLEIAAILSASEQLDAREIRSGSRLTD